MESDLADTSYEPNWSLNPATNGLVSTARVSPADLRAAILARIGSGEAPGYNVLYGGHTFDNGYADHPRIGFVGPDGRPTHAAGRYQFEPATWDMQAKRLGLRDFSPASQDAAAWDLASRTYQAKTDRDILADAQAGNVQWGALGQEWPSLAGAKAGPPGAVTSVGEVKSNPLPTSPGISDSQVVEAAPQSGMDPLIALQLSMPQHKFTPVNYDPWAIQAAMTQGT